MTNKISVEKQKKIFRQYGNQMSMIDSNNNIASLKAEIKRSQSNGLTQPEKQLSYKRGNYKKRMSVSCDHKY
jgi:hypothetical protein